MKGALTCRPAARAEMTTLQELLLTQPRFAPGLFRAGNDEAASGSSFDDQRALDRRKALLPTLKGPVGDCCRLHLPVNVLPLQRLAEALLAQPFMPLPIGQRR